MRSRYYLAFIATLLLAPYLFGLGIPYRDPDIEGFHPLDADKIPANTLQEAHPTLLKMNTTLFRDTAVIDFEGRKITFFRLDKATNIPVWAYHYSELDEYMRGRQRFAFLRLWKNQQTEKATTEKTKKGMPSLEFELPVNYPAWARRVLGKEPPRLTIDGFQEISLTFEKSETIISGKEDLTTKPGLNFDQNNSFTIRGSVGRLISIEIKAGKEQEFDFSDPLKDFKIQYKEDSVGQLEDEIVQEVVAGFTNFEMPGAGLAGYSESHEGLFGIKIRSQFGPLTLTTIASHEQGEVEKKKFTPGAGNQNTSSFSEKEFLSDRFFFLDTVYRNKYMGRTQSAPKVVELRVYKWVQTQSGDPNDLNDYARAYYGDAQEPGNFMLLRKDMHYYLNEENGWIRFDSATAKEDRYAIYMRTADTSVIPVKGDTTYDDSSLASGDTVLTRLWVLKNKLEADSPNDSTWNLMWRNVYRIPEGANVDNFKLSVFRIKPGSTDSSELEESTKKYFSNILGIADENGKPLTQFAGINADGKNAFFDFDNKYIVMPPYASDSLGNRPFTNPALGQTSSEPNINPSIYTVSPDNPDWTDKIAEKFHLIMTGTTKETVYELGWGVTNERVLLNGVTPLVENVDYVIDRESGRLELISSQALDAQSIEVEYQQESFFVFEKRAFLGAHGKLDLPFIGKSSYIGASVLYQNETARDKIPRIGHVPFNKFLVGANTLIDFEPEWMTTAVNFLPLITTSAGSTAKIDLEVAHSRQTPNTGSEAYIDDFESSNQVFSLGTSHMSWYKASPPIDFKGGENGTWDSLLYNPPAWKTYWYSPEGDDRAGSERDNIWKLKDTTDLLENRYARTIRLICQPAPPDSIKDLSGQPLNANYQNPWSGMMTYLPGGLADRQKDRYLEIWVKNTGGGKLHIDMGHISEDLSLNGGPPNSRGDYEDPRQNAQFFDSTLNKGLDGLADTAETLWVPNLATTSWDKILYGDPRLNGFANDPHQDNWDQYYSDNAYQKNRSKVNGAENDKYLTSEDINRNGWSTREKFFRATIDFSSPQTSPYYDANANSAQPDVWQRFRIPLADNPYFDTVYAPGTAPPAWNDIRFVRIWWTDFPANLRTDSLMLEFASIEFVGNQWQPRLTGDSIKIEASVLNTEDDPEMYWTPPAMVWEQREEGTKNFSRKEQALRLSYRGLAPGEEALAERFFTYQNINLAFYEQIRLFVKPSGGAANFSPVDPNTWFVFRFGINDSTYYEYRERFGDTGARSLRERGWYEGIAIDLREISKLKNTLTDKFDSASVVRELPNGAQYRLKSRTGIAPSFSDVKWMAVGVARDRDDGSGMYDLDSGDVWINGLRVSGISSLNGWAFRGNLSTQWADFMSMTLSSNYEDADFRQMSENYQSLRDSRVGGGISAQWSLDKFIPAQLGFSLPLNTGVTGSLMRPKIQPGSDIYLTHDDGRPDRLNHMAGDFAGMIFNSRSENEDTKAEHWEQTAVNRSIGTSYSKSPTSENPLVGFTAERITTNASYGRDTTVTHKGPRDDATLEDHLEIFSKRTYRGKLGYDLSPRKPPAWTKWSPFKEIKGKDFPRQMKQYELTYLPSTFNFNLVDGTYTKSHRWDTRTNLDQREKTLGIDQGFQVKYRPVKPILDLDFDFNIVRNFDNDIKIWDGSWGDFLQYKVWEWDHTWRDYLITYGEKKRTQRAGLRLSPQFVDWLTHSADYSASYTHYPQNRPNDSTNYLSAGVNSAFGFHTGLRIRTLLTDMADATEKIEAMSKALETMEGGLGKINLNDFNFDYSASLDLKNEYLDTSFLSKRGIYTLDYFVYQLGKKDRSAGDMMTGDMDDRRDFGGVRYRLNDPSQQAYNLYVSDLRTTNQSWTASTSMRFPQPIDLSFNSMSLGWKRKYTHKPDTSYIDTVITWPEIRVSASSSILDRITILKQQMTSMSLSSTYSFKKDSAITYDKINITREHGWAPLVSFRGTLKKWPISTGYRHDYTHGLTESRNRAVIDATAVSKVSTDRKTHENTANVNYSVRAARRPEIKVFRWTIPIKGELSMGLEGKHKHMTEEPDSPDKFEEDRTELSISPNMSYYFTENVKGEVKYLGSKMKDERMKEEKNDHQFTMTVRIDF